MLLFTTCIFETNYFLLLLLSPETMQALEVPAPPTSQNSRLAIPQLRFLLARKIGYHETQGAKKKDIIAEIKKASNVAEETQNPARAREGGFNCKNLSPQEIIQLLRTSCTQDRRNIMYHCSTLLLKQIIRETGVVIDTSTRRETLLRIVHTVFVSCFIVHVFYIRLSNNYNQLTPSPPPTTFVFRHQSVTSQMMSSMS